MLMIVDKLVESKLGDIVNVDGTKVLISESVMSSLKMVTSEDDKKKIEDVIKTVLSSFSDSEDLIAVNWINLKTGWIFASPRKEVD